MKKFLFFAVALALGCLCCHGQAYMDEVKIKERNLLSVYQNGNDKIMANGRPIDLSDLKMEVNPSKYSTDEIGFYSQDEAFSKYIGTMLKGVKQSRWLKLQD